MQRISLGFTGLEVSRIAFGAGPVSGLLTGADAQRQCAVIAGAVELGINWFDTAATYGQGQSERNLGLALEHLRPAQPLHVATKVRVQLTDETDLRPLVVQSLRESLQRLRRPFVDVLQIHNSITVNRGDLPTSITPDDVLGPRGMLAAMEDLRSEGLVHHFGLTGLGDAGALRTVIRTGCFATLQTPFHLLNPTSLHQPSPGMSDTDFGGFVHEAHAAGMACFAIRVYAAGALLGAVPSAHTRVTPFFPLELYERDTALARRIAARLGSVESLRELALRYVLTQPEFASTIIGFGEITHLKDAARICELGPLTRAELERLEAARDEVIRKPAVERSD